jgi:hypothetical protein
MQFRQRLRNVEIHSVAAASQRFTLMPDRRKIENWREIL